MAGKNATQFLLWHCSCLHAWLVSI